MKFLTVFILVTFYRNWMGDHPLEKQIPATVWFSAVSRRITSLNLNFLVSVVLPSVVLLLISIALQGWFLGLFWLVLSVLVLVYCVGLMDTDTAFGDQLIWLRNLRDEGGRDDLAKLQRSHDKFSEDITYIVFQNMVPPLFWFLLLGPAGALFYSLTRGYLEQFEQHPQESNSIRRILYWMEWIPARVSILIFALLGEFNRTWEVFIDSIVDTEVAASVSLSKAANSAIGKRHQEFSNVIDFVVETEVELNHLKPLLDRSLWGWLGVAAILTILGL
jgi:AmpE protein